MSASPPTDDEAHRLQVLLSLNILDTPAEERFDRITRLASRLFGVPIALVSLADTNRLWFKSRHGLEAAEMARAGSFCDHAIQQDEVLVVEDALADPRFVDNPLVTGCSGVRFYAGAPLAAPDGSHLGTLCLIDRAPRRFTDDDRAALRDLADIAADELAAVEVNRALNRALHDNRATDERRRKHFSTATHELRTPMASVLGFSELLLKREFDAATGRELVEIIHRQASRLVALINQLLDLARIEAGGKEELDIRPLAAHTLIEQTLAGLVGLGDIARVRVHVADGLPPLAGDADKLQQALTNILSNSIKYSAPGSAIEVDARAATLGAAPAVALRVTDHGIGMSPDQQAQVYDAFYRADPGSPVQGSGLGMTIFKEIIELHGGVIELQSASGAGTAVTMLLPAAAKPHG